MGKVRVEEDVYERKRGRTGRGRRSDLKQRFPSTNGKSRESDEKRLTCGGFQSDISGPRSLL